MISPAGKYHIYARQLGFCALDANILRDEGRPAVRGNMEIADWRNKIDELDEKLVQLLSERAAAAAAIGKLKAQQSAPIYEPQREQAVFEHVRKVNPGPLSDVQIQHVYERLMDVMRQLQRPQ
jgi:chorismate mutase-like protein